MYDQNIPESQFAYPAFVEPNACTPPRSDVRAGQIVASNLIGLLSLHPPWNRGELFNQGKNLFN